MVVQEHNPNRVSVYLDGEFAFGIGLDAAASARLDVGQLLSTEQVNELNVADEIGRATESALRLLARRPRSEREISDRLRRKGFEQVTIERAIERLEGWNYVDDAEFARYWVENRTAHKPRGRRLLEQELRTKGVDREVVKEAIEEAEVDEESAAFELAQAKLPSYRNDDPMTARRKLVGYLQRRGFNYGGGVTWLAATQIPELDAAVPFYGPPPPLEDVPNINAAVLGVYSDNPEDFANRGRDELKAALDTAGVTNEFKIYPDTHHAFHNDTGDNYNEQQALAAWADTLAWFDQYVKGSST